MVARTRLIVTFCTLRTLYTHSQHVIVIAFPLQQWLQERASLLRFARYVRYTHTHTTCNSHCFSTATMVARTRHIVTFCAHCLFCYDFLQFIIAYISILCLHKLSSEFKQQTTVVPDTDIFSMPIIQRQVRTNFAPPKKMCYYCDSVTQHDFIMKCRVIMWRICLTTVSVSLEYTEIGREGGNIHSILLHNYIRFVIINKWNNAQNTTLTLRRLMSYIYGATMLDVSRSHTTTQHSR